MKREFLRLEAALVMAAMLAAPGLSFAAPKQPKNVIGMAKARKIALKTVNGKITGGELEYEKKIWIYSFDMSGKDGKNHEVNVNALTGKIVSATIETPAMEAQELKQDRATGVSAPKDKNNK